ncbi:MAG TPA: BamA/TamA family outer membrane protein [Mucilaginibacter sp.]|nr:BamA/TamA family outer membrane protein [Mucilaginibacter sp.]
MKKFLLFCWIILAGSAFLAKAQDSVVHRVILIGDAGEIDKQQMAVLGFAANSVIKNKTTVLYLGDNIYPRGMALPGSPDTTRTQNILKSEYAPMRAMGAPVYFIPGNHDWDRMGLHGLEKIKRQWEYIDQRQDSLLRVVPENGCPDPYEIEVNDQLVIIAYDSEWWLFPYHKSNPGADCSCNTKSDVTDRLRALFYKNRGKFIMLASHHPFQTYGPHGGVFSVKDHLFPLTNLDKNLYIPLPGIGSLYPLLRTVFVNPEDMGHPEYKDMIKKIDGVFGDYPDLIHVAGHEHGLQFIKGPKGEIQVVSGAGAKETYVVKGKNSLFAEAIQGFVTADLMTDNSMRFTYYTYTEKGVKVAFSYTKPYAPVTALIAKTITPPAADSVVVRVHPAYDSVGGFHRAIFGENYRKEWAAPVKLPYLKISQLHGGLTPEKQGGGFQSHSLRLLDPTGKEWVIRTVEKDPTKLLPDELVQTFAFGLLDDATSAQHPFGSLIVPPLADALHIPHSNPIIGVVAPDPNLGQYASTYIGKVCLFEEREPNGKSDNTEKMQKTLQSDNDNHFDGRSYVKARMLDVMIGDWDRHEDQWRWQRGKDKDGNVMYTAVPRDRDQSLYTREAIQDVASSRWILPPLQGFDGEISDQRYSMYKSKFMNAYPESKFSYAEWMKIATEVKAALTDEVFETALHRLPPEIYRIRHDELMRKFKKRRENFLPAMDQYYHFANRVADIRLSDKNEQVEITDAPNNGLTITAMKINKKGKLRDTLLKEIYDPAITQEIRLFTADGEDHVTLNTSHTDIKLRLVGGEGQKEYEVINSNNKVKLYGKPANHTFIGDSTRFRTHFNNDTATTAIHNSNLYSVWMPLVTANVNRDDGFLLGLGFRYTGQSGFRKFPYTTLQELMVTHSFSTDAFSINYSGTWTKAVGKADLLMQAVIKAPDNTMNFFGRGNGSVYDKNADIGFYRIRFNTYDFNPALRWHTPSGSTFSIGPSLSYYTLDLSDNTGRLINDPAMIGSYDSTTVSKDKIHAGVVMHYINDTRNNPIFPSSGIYINLKVQGYAGLNTYSKSFAQIIPEIAFYRAIGSNSRFVIAERVGGGVTIGQTAFYQSLFLGGQGNLLGYRQNRFAGQHLFYNNLEGRLRLGDLASYIIPGQFGLSAFYDAGRVWNKNDQSDAWHQGVGGGFYFAPAALTVFQLQAGYSKEGWFPSFSLQFRF